MAIEHVYVSEKAKTQLVRLKSKTGIAQWNHLCRWALTLSLREPSLPPMEDVVTDSNIDMTWQTFGGQYHEIYLAVLKTRMKNDGLSLDDDTVKLYFKLHLHRGISYLFKKVDSVECLFSL